MRERARKREKSKQREIEDKILSRAVMNLAENMPWVKSSMLGIERVKSLNLRPYAPLTNKSCKIPQYALEIRECNGMQTEEEK